MSFFSLVGRLACHCAKKARDKGYKVFGLQFYGECWSDENGLETYQKFGKADDKKCIMDLIYENNQYAWKYCDMASDQPCIGKDSTNYVYILHEGSVSLKISLPVHLYSDLHIQLFRDRLSKKFTRQSLKGLWVVLCSLFFKEIGKNVTRDHGLCVC